MCSTLSTPIVNVGLRLSETARQTPDGVAVIVPLGHDSRGKRQYQRLSYRQLDRDSNLLADGLLNMGARPGMRLVLLVRPGVDFISLVFAMFKAGVVTVLIDPGMGRSHLLRCLQEAEPEGFVAISQVQAIRKIFTRRFPMAQFNVTVGRRWFWGGPTLRQLRSRTLGDFQPAATLSDDPAAIIFTTGSTGPPKGVLYRHGNFNQQVDEIRDHYGIQPGGIDVSAFPLFALFNCAMGVTTIFPDMEFTRPAEVDPRNIVEAVNDLSATQAFGSPALWNTVGRYCEEHDIKLPTLRLVLTAGAPAPPHVLRRITSAIHPEGEMHTPYGATESLPVASISASEVFNETAEVSAEGGGVCVGRKFPGIQWKVIAISDDPIASVNEMVELDEGEIGELIVQGGVVTREYATGADANALHKIQDEQGPWHRLGDTGYFDSQRRFWFCGRKAHRVITPQGTMYPIRCEAIFNQHALIYRCALVGVGPPGNQRPVVIVECLPNRKPVSLAQRNRLLDELQELAQANELTAQVDDFLIHDSLPVDIRHNAKIFREKLAPWAEKQLASNKPSKHSSTSPK